MDKTRLQRILASPIVGFIPWIAFSVIEGPHRYEIAAGAALFLALVELVLGRLAGSSAKILDLAAIVFFAAMVVVGFVVGPVGRHWLENWAGELSNAMLVVISLLSMALRTPFTIQYAREMTPKEEWDSPLFLHINYVITAVWTATFAVTTFVGWYGDGPLHQPNNIWTGWLIQIALLIFAISFTQWYPDVAVAKAVPAELRQDEKPPGNLADLFLPVAGFLVPLGIVVLVFDAAPWELGAAFIAAGVLGTPRLKALSAAQRTGAAPGRVADPGRPSSPEPGPA